MYIELCLIVSFFFNDTATTEIYTLSLHDALPISLASTAAVIVCSLPRSKLESRNSRSEEHTSELQSHVNLVCRLLLEKKTNICDIKACGVDMMWCGCVCLHEV